jgi:hypothetical protein
MSHVRHQVRQAVVDALETLGGVHASRLYPISPDELPVYLVYLGEESLEGDFQTLTRTLTVIVEVVTDGQDFDEGIEDAIVEVESRVNGDLDGMVISIRPASIELIPSMEGAKPVGRARISFEAVYRTSYSDPETSI